MLAGCILILYVYLVKLDCRNGFLGYIRNDRMFDTNRDRKSPLECRELMLAGFILILDVYLVTLGYRNGFLGYIRNDRMFDTEY